jgi:DNA polymerase III subunit gamma/tau
MADVDTPQTAIKPEDVQANSPYRVLARKYRPQTFDDLIGQEAMVRTLGNAFASNRIHQAYIFTGVRGVGKTTTARILARGFNYEREDGTGGPSIDLKVQGKHCQSIIEGRHVDVIEMDAASHTGIGDIREIIESVRYKPAYARNKVYIIDEVHMLSTAAFNGLLKTLEEPPPHVKFLFATTEIRKVPITVLSRCQRFDLRRVDVGVMVKHLQSICELEKVSIETDALLMIARAAEGSVRDALSLLDQAIAYGTQGANTAISADNLRSMLGLADRTRVIDLFESVMLGRMAATLDEFRAQYDAGADPAVIISDLADYVHLVTRLKLVSDAAKDPAMTQTERTRGLEFAGKLPMRVLTRAWQILLKGLSEVQGATRPIAAAEMVLVRLGFAADLPTPDEALRMLRDGGAISGSAAPRPLPPSGGARMVAGGGGASAATQAIARPQLETHTNPNPVEATSAQPKLLLNRFEDFVALATSKREIDLKIVLERYVRPVRFEMGTFEFSIEAGAQSDLAHKIKRALDEWTGIRWVVALSKEQGKTTLHETAEEIKAIETKGIQANPLVRAVLDKFAGSQIVDIKRIIAPEIVEHVDGFVQDSQYLEAVHEADYTDDDL